MGWPQTFCSGPGRAAQSRGGWHNSKTSLILWRFSSCWQPTVSLECTCILPSAYDCPEIWHSPTCPTSCMWLWRPGDGGARVTCRMDPSLHSPSPWWLELPKFSVHLTFWRRLEMRRTSSRPEKCPRQRSDPLRRAAKGILEGARRKQ